MLEERNNDKKTNLKSSANPNSNPGFQSSLSEVSKDEGNPYNPFDHRNIAHPNTILGSILHLLKACLGTGLLAMPAAFKNSGLAVGAIGTLLAGFICTYTIHMLVKTSQELCVDAKKPSMSFSETCGAAFTFGPKRVQSWGPTVKNLTDYSMVLCYLGLLCVYVVFIGSSIKEVIDVYSDTEISIQICCAVTLIPLVLMCQIRNLKYLVPFSALANVGILVVFVITLYYVFTDLPPISEREIVASVSTWPLFVSTVIFAMEGVGVVMPVENEMAQPQRFLGCPGVLNVSMVIVIFSYGIVGFFGYLKYGDAVRGSVTLNLPEDDIIAQITKLLMALVIFFSFALQFYVPMEVITRTMKEMKWENYKNVKQIFIRTLIVCICVGIGAAFPNLELVIGLVGAIFFSTLGLFIPAVVETVHRWDKGLGRMNYVLWKNLLIALISIFALVSGSYVSIIGMIEEFYSEDRDSILDDGNHTLIRI